MKTENTLNNKSKFFAQYWGQKVYMGSPDREMPSKVFTGKNINKKDYLQLTPLDQITDEDAKNSSIYLVNVIGYNGIIKNIDGNLVKEVLDNYSRVNMLPNLPYAFIEYLRSKGYALPYLDLSINDLVEYGWIKLKNKT